MTTIAPHRQADAISSDLTTAPKQPKLKRGFFDKGVKAKPPQSNFPKVAATELTTLPAEPQLSSRHPSAFRRNAFIAAAERGQLEPNPNAHKQDPTTWGVMDFFAPPDGGRPLNPNTRHANGKTALFAAATAGHAHVVLELLNHGARPQQPVYTSEPSQKKPVRILPLHEALRVGKFATATVLLEQEARMGKSQSWNLLDGSETSALQTPMHVAAVTGQNGLIYRLLNAGANPGVHATFALPPNADPHAPRLLVDGDTPLHLAARTGNATATNAMLSLSPLDWRRLEGFYVDQPNCQAETALHAAATSGNPDVVSLLLRQGYQLQARDRAGRTPLDLANICLQEAMDGDRPDIVAGLQQTVALLTPKQSWRDFTTTKLTGLWANATRLSSL